MKAIIKKENDVYEFSITGASAVLMEEVMIAIASHGSVKDEYVPLINELFDPESGKVIITQIGF